MINLSSASNEPKSQQPYSFDVVICGAGMVGGAIACDLARRGVTVALIEKQLPQPFVKTSLPNIRVSSVNPASEQYLSELGAWSHIQSMRCQPYQRLSVWEKLPSTLNQLLPRNANRTVFAAESIGRSHLGHIIENHVIQLALQNVWRHEDNVSCFEDCSLQELTPNSDTLSLLMSNGQPLKTRLLIGADGAESRVRQLAKLGVSSSSYQQQAMVISVATEGNPGNMTWQSFTPHGPLAYLPLPAIEGITYASLVWYDTPTRHRELLGLSKHQLGQRIQREFPAELPNIQEVLARATFPLVKRHAQRYCKSRVVLVGDSAHTINPLAGQGLNLGLQDAKVLANTLATGIRNRTDLGNEGLLKTYERSRKPANQLMMSAMDAFYYSFSNSIVPIKLVRNLGLGLANKITPAKKQVLSYALGLV